MDEEMVPIDFAAWQPGTKTTRKRKSAAPPAEPEVEVRPEIRTAADSTKLDGHSIEQIAELAVRRSANVYLLGGDSMLPKTASEASNIAKVWASVAALEKARKNGQLPDELAASVGVARDAVKQLKQRVAKRA
jgi:hypothetical protein